jgi:DHA1 family tetracycline resistance protein-like MFS transporter
MVSVFIDVLGIGLAIPVLPMLVGEFAAGRDQQAYWYGALAVAYGLLQFCCAPLLGALSDRFGRRPILLASIVGLGVHYLLIALAPSLWVMLLARLLGGITGASFSVANAYASDITPPERRAKSFGMIGAMFGLGFICGPMLGGLLGGINLHLPFYVAAAFSLANAVYGYLLVPESLPRERRAAFSLAKANPFSALKVLAQRREIGGLLIVLALTVFAQFVQQTTWVLYTHFRFGWGPGDNGIALFCVGVVAAIVQGGLLSRLLRYFGEVRLALLGLTTGTIAYLLYGLASHGWMMYVIIFGNFLSFAVPPALQAIVSKAVDPRHQGVTMGSLNSISSIMFVMAPLLGTPLLAQVSHLRSTDWRIGATFFVCAAVQAVALFAARRHFAPRVLASAA